jgi:hypothetical protein
MKIEKLLLASLRYRFKEIKRLGDGTLAQVDESALHWRISPEANSIAIIIQHLHGNMVSRWTDFLTTDGNKPWRDRDGEFEPKRVTKAELLKLWELGWECALRAIDGLSENDLTRKVTIRGQELDAIDACLRNIIHCGYHVGQIVNIAKERLGDRWQTLSIARGKSKEYRPKRKD